MSCVILANDLTNQMTRCARIYSRNVKGMRNYGPRSYQNPVTYTHASGNYGIRRNPAFVTDGNRRARKLGTHSFRIKNMVMIEDTYVGPEHSVFANGNSFIRVDADIRVAIHMIMASQHRFPCHLDARIIIKITA